MKKRIALLLCAVMLAALLAGCGSAAPASEEPAPAQDTGSVQQSTTQEQEPAAELPAVEVIEASEPQSSQISLTDANDFNGRDDIAYVLIYNPAGWDEEKSDGMGKDTNEIGRAHV